ncbi:hypothetical protein D3C74_403340 [compost metagenome]
MLKISLTIGKLSFKFTIRSFRTLFLPTKWAITKIVVTVADRTVVHAAPAIPILKVKMKSGLRIISSTVPITSTIVALAGCPSARITLLRPAPIPWKTLPIRIMVI